MISLQQVIEGRAEKQVRSELDVFRVDPVHFRNTVNERVHTMYTALLDLVEEKIDEQ